ncbi:hypothetical protein RRG08_034731 [Elysia crispata]|uniref:Uncharacterized protein n=1 Tax=Elysia crispata TaxID=231223 RepID=A0AAE1CRV4_9GAST|nr:hypothetical protein RRG08_034731 [Elysia crispata]
MVRGPDPTNSIYSTINPTLTHPISTDAHTSCTLCPHDSMEVTCRGDRIVAHACVQNSVYPANITCPSEWQLPAALSNKSSDSLSYVAVKAKALDYRKVTPGKVDLGRYKED